MNNMYEYFILFLVFGGVGAVIGFLVAFFGSKLSLIWSVLIFYLFSTIVFQFEAVIFGRLKFLDAFTFSAFSSTFMYYIFANTIAGLPMFLISRKVFSRLGKRS